VSVRPVAPTLSLPRRPRANRRASAGRVGTVALGGLAILLAMTVPPRSALAAEGTRCARGDIVLWGDGRHDDTAALNAWLQGDNLVWAESGEAVGDGITGRSFRLSAAIYVPGGTGRRLESFRLVWPERGETVTGGTVRAGDDPDLAPLLSGVEIVGGDPGEGVPIDTPDVSPHDRRDPARCAVS